MSNAYHIVVCASVVPDPLQTLEPVAGPTGPSLKNESMLPAILDPWASHALYEGAHLAKQCSESRLWLVSLAPKSKLQQVMMTVAQKVPFELVAMDGPAGGFVDAHQTAAALAAAIRAIPGLDVGKLLLFGGWESASRAFSYYDVNAKQWTVDPGEFSILVGGSSQSIALNGTVNLK